MSSVGRSQGEYREPAESPNINEVIDLYHNVPIEIYQKGSIQRKIEQQLSEKSEKKGEEFKSFEKPPDFKPNDRITFRPQTEEEYDPLNDPGLNKFIKPEPELEKPVERYEYKSEFARRFME